MKTAYNLFKENLGRAEMLAYVHPFALSNSEMEIDFIFGQKDKEQWQVSRIGKLGNCGRKLIFSKFYLNSEKRPSISIYEHY